MDLLSELKSKGSLGKIAQMEAKFSGMKRQELIRMLRTESWRVDEGSVTPKMFWNERLLLLVCFLKID